MLGYGNTKTMDDHVYMPLEQDPNYLKMVIRQLEKEINYLKDKQVECYQELSKMKKRANWFIDQYAQIHNITAELAVSDYEASTNH